MSDPAALEGDGAAIRDYLAYLEHQRRAGTHTLAAYRRDLDRLQAFAQEQPLASLHAPDVRRFVATLHARGLGARSLARTLSAWRGFYRWLVRQRGCAANPCEGLRPPKANRALPAVLSPDGAARLLDAAGEDLLELRDKAMFELLYSSGLRLAELAGLDCGGALDLAAGEIRVLGKRRKERLVPVGAKAREALRAWLERRVQIARAGETALFVSRRGTRLSPRMIQARLTRWARRADLGQHVHPHMLRHSFASHVLQSSGDLRAVQEMLGHANISTTQVYTHLDFQHLAKVYDAAHPRARKK